MSVLTGKAPVGEIRDYQIEVNSYTRGRGKLTLTFRGMNHAIMLRRS